MDFGKIAVLAGGFSAEREVSLTGGRAVQAALAGKGIDAHLFDPQDTPVCCLKEMGFQAAFNLLHGTFGEDGVVQGALEAIGIPYTGCGVAASAIAMDKYRTRLIWQAAGLPNVPYTVLHDDSDFAAVEKTLGLPLFAKPACEGSSIGVVKVKETGQLAQVYRDLKKSAYHGDILAEKAITGGEYACGILGGRALPSIRIVPKNEFYDYEAKYFRDDTDYLCPSGLDSRQEAEMADLALRAFAVLGGRSWGRIDFLRDDGGRLYLLEANTVPGMTAHSLVPQAAAKAGIGFAELCVEILSHAVSR